ncbi:MAG TPA: glycosyltransferase family 87 protein [Candidatus Sulfopaludibacter sp.]|jgi:hypothetical protein|nr:glycosyltransferase family 87 protein [Candidatus Sulfopaludibacter sp.]
MTHFVDEPGTSHAGTKGIVLSRGVVLLLCLFGCALLWTSLFLARGEVNGTDFLALYAGARLVGTGHMYDPQAIWKVQLAAIGHYGPSLLFTRIPCFALFLWPLAQLPYAVAKAIWIAFQVLTIVGAVWLWPGSRRLALVVICWSLPLLMCLADGADTALLLFWLVLWLRLECENRPFSAGMALALCIAKFHLFLFLPLLLFRHRRWRVMQGAVAGICGLVILSFIAGGWHWPTEYFHVLTTPGINPGRYHMPNLHGLMPPGVEFPAMLLTLILCSVAIFKLNYTAGLIVSLFGSLLCSYHAYVMDGVILCPAIILLIERRHSRWLSYLAGILVTPIPWIAVLIRRP